ncbi:MAG: Methyltransferase [Candidatus Angelobacter sp.]|jgi:SAM-dependent methyltransferase|nr:Methyltransferase [Candidatus Angelobacter sp.]
MVAMSHPTTRFSNRVDNYIRYRPSYPPELLQLLESECGLTPNSVIADIGSGTGILSRILLDHGNTVFGVEPNPEMRAAGERLLASYKKFHSIVATAEATGLPSHSIDIITAAQAAHWFDTERARSEFVRILKPGGWVLLIWNERRADSTPFLAAYEQLLLTFGTDYEKVRHENTTSNIDKFFAASPFKYRQFENCQRFDYPALEGRLLSSSYIPDASHPRHSPMLDELRRLFDLHQSNGQIAFDYDTRVYYSQLA